MIAEFVDSNVLVYAFDFSAGLKRSIAGNLLKRLDEGGNGGLSTQVLTEFYSVATRKLGMASVDAEQVIRDLAPWALHRPDHAGVLRACELHRRFGLAWWDAVLVQSAIELQCEVLWTEDLSAGQRFGPVTVRNPFAEGVSV